MRYLKEYYGFEEGDREEVMDILNNFVEDNEMVQLDSTLHSKIVNYFKGVNTSPVYYIHSDRREVFGFKSILYFVQFFVYDKDATFAGSSGDKFTKYWSIMRDLEKRFKSIGYKTALTHSNYSAGRGFSGSIPPNIGEYLLTVYL